MPSRESSTDLGAGRIRSLDGLRGLAAMVVLLEHSLLTLPSLNAASYFGAAPAIQRWSPQWWLSYTPLHLIWAGSSAVLVFFVISGLVLVRPALDPDFGWRAYYRQRLARLYLPVLAALVFGYAVILAAPTPDPQASAWMHEHLTDPSWRTALFDVTLVTGSSGLIGPLWSLQWEILFSIELVLFVAFARARPGHWLLKATVLLALMIPLRLGPPGFYSLLVIALGAMLAFHLPQLHAATRRWRAPAWWTLAILSACLLQTKWLVPGMAEVTGYLHWATPAAALGATGIVVAAALSPQISRLLSAKPVQWMGRISFSLYLTHEPIVVTSALVAGSDRLWISFPLAIVISLVVAQLFYRFIERPLHRFARKLGHAGSSSPTRATSPTS